MTKLQEITEGVQFYDDYTIERLMQRYTDRKYNICIKMERGIYSQKQADRNYERAAKIYTVLYNEKHRRMIEQDKYFRAYLDSIRGTSLGVVKKIDTEV